MSVNIYEKLGNKISEQLQMHEEEKWILEAMELIKEARNELQIEALHIESLKAKLRSNNNESTITKESQPNISVQTNRDIEIDIEQLCNDEELNLMVTDPILGKPNLDEYSEEEEEDDEYLDSEEGIDVDDILLDINMLMFRNENDGGE